MDRPSNQFVDVQWVARCAHRLRRQWPHADVASLEEAAVELWRVDWLREMTAEAAAELWLRPLSRRVSDSPSTGDREAPGSRESAT